MVDIVSETNREYFEVNFTENKDVRPETVKAGDIAEVIKTVESMVESKVLKNFPDIKRDKVVIGFTNIRASSVDLQFYSPYKDTAKSSFQEIGQAINNNNYSSLPEPSFKACGIISAFSKKYKCNAEFIHQNGKKIVLAKITQNTKIERPRPLKGETTVYAKVIRVGGKEPKVEIETVDNITLYCDAPFDVTKKLGTKLYQIVGLVGIAQWDFSLNNIESFSIKEITEYEKIPFKQAMDELSNVTREYYSNITDVDQYISELRGPS